MTQLLPALGELELGVMEDVWQAGDVDAKDMQGRVGEARSISLNTVQPTLERLFRKRLLSRDKVSRAYCYREMIDRKELVGRLIEATIGRVTGAETEVLMSAFVDIASRAGDEQFSQLETLIAAQRAARDGGSP